MPRKSYVMGSFTLSWEHIELSRLAGTSLEDLFDQYLTNIEVDLRLKPKSLFIYFGEMRGDYREFYYTENGNSKFIEQFEAGIFNHRGNTNPTTN